MGFEKLVVGENSLYELLLKLDEALPENFVLWLKGEMGAGKTTLVRHYLRGKGLSDETPVVSPTYTIMNEYQIGDRWYAHLDLYRAEDSFSLDEIGVKDRDYRGIFLEWPDTPGDDETIAPSHILHISYEEDGQSRGYRLETV
ncbi:tRNA (adenosine(37)-N6)-threonylcarbamoyltransferase complex ATPase subunit type 1 TsaE [Pseudobacteriovorax antillogorgiicola]|uniref:tRNA threonylcarbamoyladenosine biosynthesis protein TsaE n=1 Tax=Pseudobacteriovorax antillogorgiicola TaxID=1513793 RepID=A0A1Y6CSC0_9BACT|nr:tRNA (adenosine(37)-N6)-threonylcarbamoyltransferase complex ATPase subunit type 1 TsaE [Pseudobacteriovorax antillogorgiicola]TCS46157.1 tRNA threonylcarbamoyladenosine biosynthesis protein TsaE [Pseudobacteriovorax antillogorgiicola]SMF69859.1 tRNA threonylcarbamoyladenosine biosynthesis protein TsaE [Pseudobacteriovorax antillogorgiicola]